MSTLSSVFSSGSLLKLRPFLLWLVVFYSVWILIVASGHHFDDVRSHWPIALSMSFGSYIAGSTPMGGGTVGFPVLVLMFDMPGSLGRNFALAVQSIGMVSASIYILSSRKPLDWAILKPALLGALIGTPVGATWIAPVVADIWIKLIFAIIWASFGVMHLMKMRQMVAGLGAGAKWNHLNNPIGLTIGLLGGVAASVTGVGIDMIIYAVLMLLYRQDMRVAIPTSVVLMAFTSVVGIASNAMLFQINPVTYYMDPEVFFNWLAAAPVVALGAPLGAFMVTLIPRKPTLVVVSLLCIFQFVWTIVEVGVTGLDLVAAIAGVFAFNAVFHWLNRAGRPVDGLGR